ncbi:Ubiquinone biosynthesis protein COQ7 [Desulfosporosinus acidiphilus SJ4]|uniref:Ubiquinone biosynthesis protein COQ7 n=1 Tax=Desulfosporosinus acidiphilus (strain DSM 22704 / JCM 16185 / SJ4) TaxID=646529 RepID=I4D510_DESAJ|nr:ferritin-like domain-containing protein [Desulfosporosinus acidiphilus]AFM40884.1 Ubiquinone biosynthesis protein COQ7 [Desulfosporosinus acidiphilus SJ4]
MDQKLLSRFKEFYTLETFQVAYYNEQLQSSTDEYYCHAFEKMAQIEQGHVDFFAEELDKANVDPPTVKGSVFSLAGTFLGDMVKSTGAHNTCKLGMALENKAIQTYQAFIQESTDKKYSILRRTLMEYRLDEEFHSLWLQDYMKKHPI